jgi:ABC-type nitrate/sulfonate/bicarbonate transport system substrate-binding protein
MHAPEQRILRVGGVPEHFNLPWHLARQQLADTACASQIDWQDFASGTGAMLAELAAGRLDVAILLTEGAALGLARGLPIEALSLYTSTPLIWGVHSPPAAGAASLAELRGRRIAISRHGSGSHLMSLALAMDQGWPIDTLQFELVDDLPGAIRAFRSGRAEIFLWEHFTTAPYVEDGTFRRVDDFVSPWPAWVVCINRRLTPSGRAACDAVFREVTEQARLLQQNPGAAALIGEHYGLLAPAVAAWLARTDWVAGPESPTPALAAATAMLAAAGALPA